MASPMSAAALLAETLPHLRVGPSHTTSSALHPVKYVGRLRPWPNFKPHVMNTIISHNFSQQALSYAITGPTAINSLATEHLRLGDEHGVQGRLQDRIGHVLSAIFAIEDLDICCADFRCGIRPPEYKRTPDVLIMSHSGESILVGELKVKWVEAHDISRMMSDFLLSSEGKFRKAIGQIARYMKDLGLKYAYLTTYDQTVFLRQAEFGRELGLEYSPLIQYSDMFNEAQGNVTLRQCFFHVALLASRDSRSSTDRMRSQVWTEDL